MEVTYVLSYKLSELSKCHKYNSLLFYLEAMHYMNGTRLTHGCTKFFHEGRSTQLTVAQIVS